MTPKQAERIPEQIAAVQRRFGTYDDSSGWRYLPPKLYLQLGYYAGGMRYGAVVRQQI